MSSQVLIKNENKIVIIVTKIKSGTSLNKKTKI